MGAVTTLLEVRNLRVGYRREDACKDPVRIVDGVSFEVRQGEVLGLVGESGCGKTTTGLAILRLNARTRRDFIDGEVLFQGRDVLRMDETALRAFRGREVSMILQDPMASLNPVFTVGDQIEEGVLAHGAEAGGDSFRRVLEALRQVRIPAPEARARSYPHQLSGGMQQRVVGAVAIACRPKLLIADEPTTSLDVTIQAQYLQLLKDLQHELGMSLIFITHDFGVVARMCDRVCVMYAGQIVETAPVRRLFRAAAHWYSAALIGGVPKLGRRVERLVAIPGSPPRPDQPPSACRFAARCPNVQDRCRAEAPPVVAVGGDHSVRCWFPRSTA